MAIRGATSPAALAALPPSLSILLRAEMTEASPLLQEEGGAGNGRVGQAPEGMEPWGTLNAWREEDGGGGSGGGGTQVKEATR